MKQHWAPQELIDHWMLTDMEMTLVNQYHTNPNRVACALLLKFFEREGKFPDQMESFWIFPIKFYIVMVDEKRSIIF